jgi:hypothetical protein
MVGEGDETDECDKYDSEWTTGRPEPPSSQPVVAVVDDEYDKYAGRPLRPEPPKPQWQLVIAKLLVVMVGP